MPDEDEVRALLALMLAQHARRDARLVDGELVTLEHQDRSRWDREAVAEALSLTMPHGRVPGPYRLQAELALTHLRAEHADDTDWRRIVRLYERLLDLHPSPVISLNRAIAVGMAESPAAGLLLLDDLADAPRAAGAAPAPGRPRRPAGPGRPDRRGRGRGRACHRAGADRAGAPAIGYLARRARLNHVSWGYRVPRGSGAVVPRMGGVIMSNRTVRVAAVSIALVIGGTIATTSFASDAQPKAARALAAGGHRGQGRDRPGRAQDGR